MHNSPATGDIIVYSGQCGSKDFPCLVYRHHVLSRKVLGEGVDSRSSCGEIGLEISDGESVTRLETIQNRVIRYVDAKY